MSAAPKEVKRCDELPAQPATVDGSAPSPQPGRERLRLSAELSWRNDPEANVAFAFDVTKCEMENLLPFVILTLRNPTAGFTLLVFGLNPLGYWTRLNWVRSL